MKTNFIKTLFVTLFLLSVNIVNAHDFVSNGIYYNITNATNKTVAVTYKGSYYDSYYNEYTGSVVIPESVSYNGKVYSVTSIGDRAFYDCDGLTSITIPNSVTSIGDDAFRFCSGLTSITIPNGVTSIGDRAFYDCEGLTSVTIGNSVTSIGYNAFYHCDGLTSITIPNSVTSIGNYAFDGCEGLKEVHINDIAAWCSIGFEGGYANPLFYAQNLYLNNELITELVIPNGVTSIGGVAFYNCSGLTSITIPNSVTSIGESAFYGCSGLTSITIPDGVTSIGDNAFRNCSGLTSIVIPNSVTSIGNWAFNGCSGLTSIEIPNSVTSIGSSAFYGCSGLTSITIPNSVTSIGNYAFRNCSGLTSITIGNSVTSIGDEAFYDCKGLKTVVNFSSLTLNIGSQDYGYVTYYADKVINAPNGGIVGDFVFSTVDGKHTLSEYSGNASEIILPDNYKGEKYAIGNNVFKYNSSITSITIPNSVTSIGDYAFLSCLSLTNVTIGKGVINMGGGVFYGCLSITTITLLGEIPPVIINTDDDYEYDFTPQQYETVVLYVPEGSLDVYKSAYVWKEFFNIKEFDNTGIENLEAGSFNGLSDVYYDLNGCIVDNPTKGIYIINGKKVLVK